MLCDRQQAPFLLEIPRSFGSIFLRMYAFHWLIPKACCFLDQEAYALPSVLETSAPGFAQSDWIVFQSSIQFVDHLRHRGRDVVQPHRSGPTRLGLGKDKCQHRRVCSHPLYPSSHLKIPKESTKEGLSWKRHLTMQKGELLQPVRWSFSKTMLLRQKT